ncbi:YcxB family protein [Streptomyces sp. NPDC058279]|uniref:YcxB family protein n=1 Tax=Streptomyces sp. NPDC058279 TaxID=3346418 RepID=UPI0036EF0187
MDIAADRAVELVFRATTADVAEALRARSTRTRSGRRSRWMLPTMGTVAVLSAVLLFRQGGHLPGAVGFLAAGLTLWVGTVFGPRLTARAFGGLLERAGETRVVIDGSGVLVATEVTETRVGWAAHPTYAETDGLFVLLSDDKRAVAFIVLPKRGAQDPADIDRLRAVLDRNLRRV